MHELVVILSDLFPPLPHARSAEALPRLAALETLLARARREHMQEGWRAWLARREGAPQLAPAALVARAWGVSCGGCWLATPVHLLAGIDRVLLHPAGLLQLSAAEQQHLVEQFAQVFADSPWRLRAGGQRELLLLGSPPVVGGSDPARFLGSDPTAGLPQGNDAGALRRLGSELELWLHEHTLNQERLQRGELPVTTLWLWGGVAGAMFSSAPQAPLPPTRQRMPLQLYGSDTYAAALVRVLGGECLPLPARLDSALLATPAPGAAIALYPLYAQVPDSGHLARLEHLERYWLAPALAALRAGRIDTLVLVAADHVYHLRQLDRWRVWHARAPWWEVLR